MNTEPALEAGLRSYLIGHPAVRAVQGDRIFPIILPQGVEYPASTYTCIWDDTGQSHDRTESEGGSPRYRIDIWAETAREAKALHRTIKAALLEIDHAAWPNCYLSTVVFIGAVEMYDADAGLFHIAADYYFLFNERAF